MSIPTLDLVKVLRREALALRHTAERITTIADELERGFHAGAQVLDGPAAIRALLEHTHVGQEGHYRVFYELLAARDIVPRGEKPLATLLSALHRDEHFVALGERSGRFRRIA